VEKSRSTVEVTCRRGGEGALNQDQAYHNLEGIRKLSGNSGTELYQTGHEAASEYSSVGWGIPGK